MSAFCQLTLTCQLTYLYEYKEVNVKMKVTLENERKKKIITFYVLAVSIRMCVLHNNANLNI